MTGKEQERYEFDECEIADAVTDIAFDALVQLIPDDHQAGEIADRIAREVANRLKGRPPGTNVDEFAEPPCD